MIFKLVSLLCSLPMVADIQAFGLLITLTEFAIAISKM
jgi:hypothetical protein